LQERYFEDRKGDAMITCNWILEKQIVKMVNGCITSGCSLGKWVEKMANGCTTSGCSLGKWVVKWQIDVLPQDAL
jgi:hypothetical protein